MKKRDVLKAFIVGFGVSAILITVFYFAAPVAGIPTQMGFPAMLLERKEGIVYISWFLPLIVGIAFALIDAISLV